MSGDYDLYLPSKERPVSLQEVADKLAEEISTEITVLTAEAAQLAAEIESLTGSAASFTHAGHLHQPWQPRARTKSCPPVFWLPSRVKITVILVSINRTKLTQLITAPLRGILESLLIFFYKDLSIARVSPNISVSFIKSNEQLTVTWTRLNFIKRPEQMVTTR